MKRIGVFLFLIFDFLLFSDEIKLHYVNNVEFSFNKYDIGPLFSTPKYKFKFSLPKGVKQINRKDKKDIIKKLKLSKKNVILYGLYLNKLTLTTVTILIYKSKYSSLTAFYNNQDSAIKNKFKNNQINFAAFIHNNTKFLQYTIDQPDRVIIKIFFKSLTNNIIEFDYIFYKKFFNLEIGKIQSSVSTIETY